MVIIRLDEIDVIFLHVSVFLKKTPFLNISQLILPNFFNYARNTRFSITMILDFV